MVQEIVDLTIETMGPQLRELEAAIETEDWPQVKRLSHRLKGTWGRSGAQRASAMAAQDGRSSQEPGAGQNKRALSATGRDLAADANRYAGLVVRSTGLIRPSTFHEPFTILTSSFTPPGLSFRLAIKYL